MGFAAIALLWASHDYAYMLSSTRRTATIAGIVLVLFLLVFAALVYRAQAVRAAKVGSKAVGYFTCGDNPAPVNNNNCSQVCGYRDPVYGLNTCSNWDLCKQCLGQYCNEGCTVPGKKPGTTKQARCKVVMTGQSVQCFK